MAAGDKGASYCRDARTTGVSAFRQINQIFPSGLELPFRIHGGAPREPAKSCRHRQNLKAVAELQSRLIAAQQLMERDYWRLRGRKTAIGNCSTPLPEPVLLIAAASCEIVEANPSRSPRLRSSDWPARTRSRSVP